jgi:DNA-binding response OmpR family regulator
MSHRVLLVEDDELIGTMVQVNLEHHDCVVRWAKDGETALEILRRERHDVVLLDLMLPGRSGLEVASEARRLGVTTPILMLTVRHETPTKVAALDAGIDDYLTKPFDMDELLARVRALVRRGQAASEMPSDARLQVAGGELDLEGLTWAGPEGTFHSLSEKEAALLALLARSAGRTLTRADIIDEVWGMDAVPTERTVDNFILRLRRLVEVDPESPRFIVTVRGRGYRLEA